MLPPPSVLAPAVVDTPASELTPTPASTLVDTPATELVPTHAAESTPTPEPEQAQRPAPSPEVADRKQVFEVKYDVIVGPSQLSRRPSPP